MEDNIRHFGVIGKPESLSCVRMCQHCTDNPPELEEHESLTALFSEVSCPRCIGAEMTFDVRTVLGHIANEDYKSVLESIIRVKQCMMQLEGLAYAKVNGWAIM